MKKIVFITGTRADFGKLKSLIKISQESNDYDVHIFATGMHMNSLYGSTVDEIYKSGFSNIYQYINHEKIEFMDRTLAKTVEGFSHYIEEIKPDMIVVHGDRLEALAGAIVGSFNNILVTHIEGGEISGTIDESIRHSVSKLAHIHLVANDEAKLRLIQLGEIEKSIYVIGSPDLDLMNPEHLPNLDIVKEYYGIKFDKFSIAMFHPVTTEYHKIPKQIKEYVDSLIESNFNYVVIYPNNDLGSLEVLHEYDRLKNNERFRIFPSLRFEYFLTLLKNAMFIVGNSSAGVREAPYYDIPSVDIGTRQKSRAILPSIFHTDCVKLSILNAIEITKQYEKKTVGDKYCFGEGNSNKLFLELLDADYIWQISNQKQFQELSSDEKN